MLILVYFSTLVYLILYSYVVFKEKSYINFLTPFIVIFFPANFIIPIILYSNTSIKAEITSGGLYVYFGYIAFLFFYIFGYYIKSKTTLSFRNSPAPNTINKKYKNRYRSLAIICLSISILTFLPVWIEFKEHLLNPREIYKLTRAGYGIYYFPSLLFLYLYLTFAFFSERKIILHLAIFLLLAYFHGTKNAMLWGIFFYSFFHVYFSRKKVNGRQFLIFILLIFSLVIGAFILTDEDGKGITEIFSQIIRYADYTTNAIKVVDNFNYYFDRYYWGQLFFEDNFYSKIPRAIFEDKPRSYGSFTLAEAVYPAWFELNIGDASFGLMGRPYVDFGYYGIIFISAYGFFSGLALKYCLHYYYLKPTPTIAILALFFANISYLSLGPVYPLIEHIILSTLIFISLNICIFCQYNKTYKYIKFTPKTYL